MDHTFFFQIMNSNTQGCRKWQLYTLSENLIKIHSELISHEQFSTHFTKSQYFEWDDSGIHPGGERVMQNPSIHVELRPLSIFYKKKKK